MMFEGRGSTHPPPRACAAPCSTVARSRSSGDRGFPPAPSSKDGSTRKENVFSSTSPDGSRNLRSAREATAVASEALDDLRSFAVDADAVCERAAAAPDVEARRLDCVRSSNRELFEGAVIFRGGS